MLPNLISSAAIDLDLSDVQVIFVPEEVWHLFRQRLEEWAHRPSSSHLIILCEGINWTPAQDNLKIRIVYMGNSPDEVFTQLAWEFVFLSANLYLPETITWKYKNSLDRILLGVHLVASEMKDFRIASVKNLIQNLKSDPCSLDFEKLKGCFKGIPAIICGAGPSLTDQIPALKEASQRAIIFAGGSALAALSRSEVPFHVAAGTDPDPDYIRFKDGILFEKPFFYQDRFSSSFLSKIHGSKIRVPANRGYVLEEWLQRNKTDQDFDGGWTVTNFMASLATYMECCPIILVGTDFSFDHAVYTEILPPLEENRESISLGDKKTKADWMMAALWMEELVAKNQEIKWVNTSYWQPNISIECAPFLEMIHSLPQRDIRNIVHSALAKESNKDQREMVSEDVSILEQSFFKTCSLLDNIISSYEAHFPQDPSSLAEFALWEIELIEEIWFQKILEPVWFVWSKVWDRMNTGHKKNINLHRWMFLKEIMRAYQEQGIWNDE